MSYVRDALLTDNCLTPCNMAHVLTVSEKNLNSQSNFDMPFA